MWRVKRKSQRKKASGRSSNKYWKYLYPLLCITCMTASWTSARYISEIEGVVDSGRTAKMGYEIVGEVYKVEEPYRFIESDTEEGKYVIVPGVTGVKYDNDLLHYNYMPAENIEEGKENEYNIMNEYLINTDSKEESEPTDASQIKVVFNITLNSEVTTRFVLGRNIEVNDNAEKYTMIIEGASLEIPGRSDIELVKGIESTGYRVLYSETIPPTNGEIQIKCTVYINYRDDSTYTVQYTGKTIVRDSKGKLLEILGHWDNPRYMNLYPSIIQVD